MRIAEAQQRIDEWIKKYGVRYFHQTTNMAILSEEVGEVARIILEGMVSNLRNPQMQIKTLETKWQM